MAINNKDVEVLSEALFCYYFAIYYKKKQGSYNYMAWHSVKNLSDLTSFTDNLGITSMVKHVNNDPAFLSRLSKVVEFLVNRKEFWAKSLESQMEAFFSSANLKQTAVSFASPGLNILKLGILLRAIACSIG